MITTTQSKPNPAWLSFVASGQRAQPHPQLPESLERDEAAHLGRASAQTSRAGAGHPQPVGGRRHLAGVFARIRRKGQKSSDVLMEIGIGKQLPMVVASRLLELAGEAPGEDVRAGPVMIRGNEGAAVQFAACCNPIPGDRIAGVINKGQGLMIHAHDRPTLARIDHDRQLEVEWDLDEPRLFGVPITVLAHSERGALAAWRPPSPRRTPISKAWTCRTPTPAKAPSRFASACKWKTSCTWPMCWPISRNSPPWWRRRARYPQRTGRQQGH